jgi:hypothetical protein
MNGHQRQRVSLSTPDLLLEGRESGGASGHARGRKQ